MNSNNQVSAERVFIGQVFDCPAQSVVEASCICKPGWGHRSFAVNENSIHKPEVTAGEVRTPDPSRATALGEQKVSVHDLEKLTVDSPSVPTADAPGQDEAREEFEKWNAEENPQDDMQWLEGGKHYRYLIVQERWIAWQAGRAAGRSLIKPNTAL